MTNLLRLFPGRPPFLKVGDTTVCLSLHDSIYLAERHDWRGRLFTVGTRRSRRELYRQYQAWKHRHLVWYRAHGIPLPPRPWTPLAPSQRPLLRVDMGRRVRGGHYIQVNGRRKFQPASEGSCGLSQ